jgi:hypothetical protein
MQQKIQEQTSTPSTSYQEEKQREQNGNKSHLRPHPTIWDHDRVNSEDLQEQLRNDM